jgi:hypothetical protein
LHEGRVVGVATRAALRPVVAERGAKVIDSVDRWMTVFPRAVRVDAQTERERDTDTHTHTHTQRQAC